MGRSSPRRVSVGAARKAPVRPARGITRRVLLSRAAGTAVALATPDCARTAVGGVARDPLRRLRRAVRGELLRPSSSAMLVYNERYAAVAPMAVLRALDVADVGAAVRWAERERVPIVARAGGHSYAGYSTVARGLVVDLSHLRGLSLRRATGEVTVGAGARLIDVYSELAATDRTIPAGSCPSVGLAGLALAGGIGLAARRYGLTCDNVSALTMVTADGRVRRCDAKANPDLFWASRGGGGGNFGIVTSFEFRTHRVGSAPWFVVSWPWDSVSEALEAWQRFAPATTESLTSILMMSAARRGPDVRAFGQYFGSPRQLRALVGPLTRVAGARLSVGVSGYMDLIMRWAGCLGMSVEACHTAGDAPGGMLPRALFGARSDYVSRPLPSAARAAMAGLIESRRAQEQGSGTFLCDAHGGAINRVHAEATAFVHRTALFSVQQLAQFAPVSEAASLEWLRTVGRTLAPFTSGEAYQGYIDPGLRTWRRAYYGDNYSRLVEIKRRYDPERVFDFPQAIGS